MTQQQRRSPTLLLDGDLLMFRAASLSENETCWDEEEDIWTLECNHKQAKEKFNAYVDFYRRKLKGGKLVVAISDRANFRKLVYPDYKGNRKTQRKPVGFRALLNWIMDESVGHPWRPLCKPTLEADDLIGILHTRPDSHTIAVSDDKDFMQLPGTFARIGVGDRKMEVFEITEEDADRFFYTQCISGDATDGYSGAKGFGFDTASKLITGYTAIELYEHELKAGKRKGEVEMRKRERPATSYWDIVESAYHACGMTPEDALLTARMARILRWSDYDHAKKEPILWSPSISTSN